eukprot:GFUD01016644.1.p1 GENE.GFUD01016644.1~~GFUD01016644.1.p1  ORF type:complete len:435 (+),score=109.62 GFUD01016644.1:50-1306(+)
MSKIGDAWLKIDQMHVKLIETGESPVKHEKRCKLEDLAIEYLSMVPHEKKFALGKTTEDLISNSIKEMPDFSFVAAINALRSIEKHAAVLNTQPKRREFWRVKTNTGFFMNDVMNALSGAEKLFLEMGYFHDVSKSVLYFLLPKNSATAYPAISSRVKTVARDCLLASAEFQMLCDIHREVSKQFPITLEKVLGFRRDNIGSVAVCAKELIRHEKLKVDELKAEEVTAEKLKVDLLKTEEVIAEKTSLLQNQTIQKNVNVKRREDWFQCYENRMQNLLAEKAQFMQQVAVEDSDDEKTRGMLENDLKFWREKRNEINSNLVRCDSIYSSKDSQAKKILIKSINDMEIELECPVCLVEATAPIFSCKEMHVICSSCQKKVKHNQCPVCRGTYDKPVRRHRFAEKMSEDLVSQRKALEDL